jgi:hypothetical protein
MTHGPARREGKRKDWRLEIAAAERAVTSELTSTASRPHRRVPSSSFLRLRGRNYVIYREVPPHYGTP